MKNFSSLVLIRTCVERGKMVVGWSVVESKGACYFAFDVFMFPNAPLTLRKKKELKSMAKKRSPMCM
jgi:hypothetical protein